MMDDKRWQQKKTNESPVWKQQMTSSHGVWAKSGGCGGDSVRVHMRQFNPSLLFAEKLGWSGWYRCKQPTSSLDGVELQQPNELRYRLGLHHNSGETRLCIDLLIIRALSHNRRAISDTQCTSTRRRPCSILQAAQSTHRRKLTKSWVTSRSLHK